MKLPDAYTAGQYLCEEKNLVATFLAFGVIGVLYGTLFSESRATSGAIEFFFLSGMVGVSIHLILFIFVQKLDPRLRPPSTSAD